MCSSVTPVYCLKQEKINKIIAFWIWKAIIMPNKHCSHGLCQSNSRKEPQRKFANFPKPRFGVERVREWKQLWSKENFDVKHVTKYMYAGLCICVIFTLMKKTNIWIIELLKSWNRFELAMCVEIKTTKVSVASR